MGHRAAVLLVVLASAACATRAPVFLGSTGDDTVVAKGTSHKWTFDERVPSPGTGEVAVPSERTFVGLLGHWGIVHDADAPSPPGVYRQDERHGAADAPRVLVSSLFFADVSLRVLCRPDSGLEGEGCGLVFDARGPDDYFVARADALEGVVRLVHVRAGEEREAAAAQALVTPHVWHALAVHTKGERVVVDWDGARVLDTLDWTRTGGNVGLATAGDAVTSYDDLEAVAE